ncbi:porin [Fluviibacter phosphoraccumulans]|nr:porin [Fluviibacter phosphoraccumulans]
MALAVAGLSTAAFAQTNVTIYGVADVSAQGTNMSKGVNPGTTKNEGGSFNMKSNSSLLGFKGTEDLGNGLKGLFQIETNVGLTGQSANQGVAAGSTSNAGWGQLRDSYVGMNSKYGTVLGGFLSTPYRSALTSFDVMPGATGDARIETMMGTQRVSKNGLAYTAQSSVRATALAYALPTMYGFDGSIAYTGSNNNGNNENVNSTGNNLYSALSTQIGWTGYGVNVKGAFQQAKMMGATTAGVSQTPANAYTSYLIGASYTGLPGLKASVVYNRNTLGGNTATLATGATSDANKGSNNQIYAGVSYRFGNNEPRLTYQNSSNTSFNGASANDGATLWGANWGYYLSKRTQVYGIVSTIKNNQNGTVNMASGGTSLVPTGGQVVTTYGAGLRTNF